MTDQPKDLTVLDNKLDLTNLSIREVSFIANEMAAAKMFPDITSAHVAFVKIMAGLAAGVAPFEAVSGIHIIQGKAVMGATLMASRVKGSPKYDYKVLEQSDKLCRIQFTERVGDKREILGVSEFTIEDARKAGTKNLDKYGRNMLFARAMSNGVKWYCPDVFGHTTVYTEGEIVETGPQTLPESPQTDAVTAGFEAGTDKGGPETMDYVDEYPTEADLQTALDALKPNPISPKQRAFLFSLLTQAGVPASKAKGALYAIASHYLSREVTKTEDISKEDAIGLIDFIQNQDAAALELFFGGEA